MENAQAKGRRFSNLLLDMRISIPSLPKHGHLAPTVRDVSEAVDKVGELLSGNRNVLAITGAGVSVASGLSSYRGENGLYMNESYRPIYFHELMAAGKEGVAKRRRYWARSYMGYPSLRRAMPNTTHYVLARLQQLGAINQLITQNVDRLHHVATASMHGDVRNIHELHGTCAVCSHQAR